MNCRSIMDDQLGHVIVVAAPCMVSLDAMDVHGGDRRVGAAMDVRPTECGQLDACPFVQREVRRLSHAPR